jgi:hypothetical protein
MHLEKQLWKVYELKEGAYEMNFNLIKRKFDIKAVVIFYGQVSQRLLISISRQYIKWATVDLVGDQLSM